MKKLALATDAVRRIANGLMYYGHALNANLIFGNRVAPRKNSPILVVNRKSSSYVDGFCTKETAPLWQAFDMVSLLSLVE